MDQEYEVNEQELAAQENIFPEPGPAEPQKEASAAEVPCELNSQVQPEPETVSEPGPGPVATQKDSPFADSPYEMSFQPQPQSTPVQPEKPAPKEKAPAKKRGVGSRVIAALLVVVMVAAGCSITALSMNSYYQGQAKKMQKAMDALREEMAELQEEVKDNSFTGNGNSVSGTPNTSADGLTPGQVYAKTYKSVVSISCSDTGFGGSGFVLTPDGYVVTNCHVIEGSSKVSVTTYQGKTYAAAVVGYDAANDIAVLKVEASGLNAVTLGSSDDLIVGDQVVAIGHPLGIETATLTVGYISAKDQSINTEGAVINMLQTDAAINSGNSGGPLFNMKGEVIGITTAKYSGSTDSGAIIESIGFAIPMDDVAQKLSDLMNFGYITGAYLGVSVTDMDSSVLDAFGFPRGAYVIETTPGYCAAKAGVKAKDMIIAIGGYQVDGVNSLSRVLQKFKAGDKTTITVWRAGAEITLDITLDAKPIPNP